MKKSRIGIHWAALPAAIYGLVIVWTRYGVLATLVGALFGLLLVLYVEHRARKRRDRTDNS